MFKSVALALLFALANAKESNFRTKATTSKRPTNAPVTKKPTKAPVTKKPTKAPIGKPSFKPTASPTTKTHAYRLTLTKEMLYVNGAFKPVILVNGQTPGPEIRCPLGDKVDITVVNNLGDAMSTLHWHGMTQSGTPYYDGPPGINQCLINTIDPATGTYLDPMNTVTELRYVFQPTAAGDYWYHGHYEEQTVDGAIGPFIVEDSPHITTKYLQHGLSYTAETTIIISDFYNLPATNYLPYYLSPASGGNEPHPEAIAVNNKLSGQLDIHVNKADKLRVRVINAAPYSMFDVSVDGMPLTVINIDGSPTVPFDVSFVPLNVAQRTSFVLDWSKLPSSMSNSPSVLFRVTGYKGMYPIYDPALPNDGLFASASSTAWNVQWVGKFSFSNPSQIPTYDIINPPASPASPPSDTNMLQAVDLFATPVPAEDLKIYYLIEFFNDESGVNRPHVNGLIAPHQAHSDISHPELYEYMAPAGGPLSEPVGLPVGSMIPGDAVNNFVLPFGRTIDILFNNTDGGEHPMHLHGHTFWVMKTSEYDSGHGVLRDIVSVPAMGWAIIRFVADNPGVWLLHCHIDWHFKAGFSSTIVEAPSKLKDTIDSIPADHKAACAPFFAPPTPTPTVAPTVSSPQLSCINQCKINNPF